MDIKNTILGLLFLLAAIYVMYTSGKQQQQLQDSNTYTQQMQKQQPSEQKIPSAVVESSQADSAPEEIAVLEDEFVKVRFTNKGGAIKDVVLPKFKKTQNSDAPYVFNANDKVAALSLAFETLKDGTPLPFQKTFKLARSDKNVIAYEYVGKKVKITRAYSLAPSNSKGFIPYVISTLTKVENISKEDIPAQDIYLSLGMASPNAGDVYGTNLAFGVYDSEDTEFFNSSLFVDSKGFLGIGSHKAKAFEKVKVENVQWGVVKNQFFATVFTPTRPANGGFVEPVLIDPKAESNFMKIGLLGYLSFEEPVLKSGESREIEGSFYVGPKELENLVDLGKDQDLVMDFGWASFVSRPLLVLLTIINSLVENISPSWSWGWAIIILTVFVRICLWPLTAVQIRSSLKMSKLQEPLAEIKKKYAGDQQKIGQETMKLYSEYGINPLAGCLPLLIQLPIFLGLYYMLQTSSGIRFAHFLWIQDLSLPDYIPGMETIFGFPLHPLPIINALITFIQMHITPMPSTDKAQRVIFKLMPLIMLLFFYTFPSGLVLYWTVQSMIGVVQAILVNRSRDTFELKKRDTSKPTFFERVNAMAEQERLRREGIKANALKGTMYENRKKNPGGRSTPPKRK